MNLEVRSIIHALTIMFVCFVWAMAWTPALIRLLQRMGMGKTIRDATKAPVMAQLHAAKAGTPTMGGLILGI
jgi:phospho-N-acetylmuramoyl-pentapeptide-transferase